MERVFIGGRIGLGFGSVGPVDVGVDLEARHNRTSLAYLKTVVLDGEVVRQAQYRADAQPNSAVGSVVVGVAVHPRVAFRTTVGFEESLASSLIARAGGDEERGEVGGVTVRWRGLRLGVGAVVRL